MYWAIQPHPHRELDVSPAALLSRRTSSVLGGEGIAWFGLFKKGNKRHFGGQRVFGEVGTPSAAEGRQGSVSPGLGRLERAAPGLQARAAQPPPGSVCGCRSPSRCPFSSPLTSQQPCPTCPACPPCPACPTCPACPPWQPLPFLWVQEINSVTRPLCVLPLDSQEHPSEVGNRCLFLSAFLAWYSSSSWGGF